jgi:hypothetical protein
VIQFNKRDLPGVLPVEDLQEKLGFEGYPYTEASALRGDGVMETFRLVSKITAKHLFARLKGGGTTAPRKSSPALPKVEVRPAPAPEPELETEPLAMLDNEPIAEAPNPFADSVPFPDDTAPIATEYDAAEEVSLDQLLAEGRTRPSTLSGDVAVPAIDADDEVEELGTEQLLEAPSAVAVMDEPEPAPVVYADNRVEELEAQVSSLRQKLQVKQTALESILRELDDLRARVSAQLE